MNCRKCGQVIKADAQFCFNCGTKVKVEVKKIDNTENLKKEEHIKSLNLEKKNISKSIFDKDKELEKNKKKNITIDIVLTIRNICSMFMTNKLPHKYLKDVYLNLEENKQYLKNITSNFEKFDNKEQILCIYKTGFFGVGKTGLVITEKHMYVKILGVKHKFYN